MVCGGVCVCGEGCVCVCVCVGRGVSVCVCVCVDPLHGCQPQTTSALSFKKHANTTREGLMQSSMRVTMTTSDMWTLSSHTHYLPIITGEGTGPAITCVDINIK